MKWIDEFYQETTEILRFAQQELSTLSTSQLNWKPSPKEWSIAECLEHLNRYTDYYIPTIERRLARATRIENHSEARHSSWFGRYSIRMIHPDNVKKQQTLSHLNPAKSEVRAGVLKQFIADQKRLLHWLEESRHYAARRVKIPVEFFPLLKLNLGDCLEFLLRHEQRHIRQIQGVINRLDLVPAKEH